MWANKKGPDVISSPLSRIDSILNIHTLPVISIFFIKYNSETGDV